MSSVLVSRPSNPTPQAVARASAVLFKGPGGARRWACTFGDSFAASPSLTA